MKTCKDQIGRILEFKKSPKRIISLVPSLTELLVDLQLEDSIVGITKFCIHPVHLKKSKTIVGGTKNINFKKIKALNPDVILCNKEENTLDIVKQCEQIALTHISNIITIDDTIELINQYGYLFLKKREATHLIEKITFKLSDFKQFINNKKTKKVAYFIWRKPWMVAANNTFINHLLQLNKFENTYKNENRYPEVNLEKNKLIGKTDLIFLSSEPYPFKEKHILELEEIISGTKIVLVDGEMFSWYGSRLLKAFDYFKSIHQHIP